MAIGALNPVEPADLAGTVSKRAVRYLKAQVEDWYDTCRGLTAWEERHLVDGANSEQLAEHGRLLDELEQVGRWMAQATQSSDFPDQATVGLIKMTLQDLKDRRA